MTWVGRLAAALVALAAAAPAAAHDAPAAGTTETADPLAGRFGGPFELVDQTGRTVTDRDFLGRFMLVYFGYTHCVDLCPIDLAIQQLAIEKLGPAGDRIASIFITVDPARDTPAVLGAFLSSFRPGTVGLTGDEAAIARVAKAYRVHRRPVSLDGPEAAPLRDTAGAYIVDHGTLAFLMGPDGRFATILPHSIDADAVARILARYVQ